MRYCDTPDKVPALIYYDLPAMEVLAVGGGG